MRVWISFFASMVVLACIGPVWADQPEIQPGFKIQDGTGDLKVNLYSNTTAVDWNNDGAKDLIVSQIYYGWVWLYLNLGTNLNPVFDGGELIESGGAPIAVTWG